MAEIYTTVAGQLAIMQGEMERLASDFGKIDLTNVVDAAPRVIQLGQLGERVKVATVDLAYIFAITLDDDYAVEIALRYSDHLQERPLNTG